MAGRKWTKNDLEQLELLYKEGKSFKEISEITGRTIYSINSKSYELKLGEKYTRNNNPNFTAIYQDYDWCYEMYINRGMSHQDMAKEAGCSVRVIEKWCTEKHKLHNKNFKETKHLSDIQKEIITIGILGDGHIDRREDQPMYIEVHAEDEKDYIFWKYNILKDICKKEPVYTNAQYRLFNDKMYYCQPTYRLNTRIICDLKEIRNMSKEYILSNITELQLALLMLDDASRNTTWNLCVAERTESEIDALIKTCNDKFGIRFNKQKDLRYISCDMISSEKIDNIILKNLPNDMDIIRKKIINNDNKELCTHKYYYVITDNGRLGFSQYCKNNKLNYTKLREYIKHYLNEFDEISENELLNIIQGAD